MRSRRALLWAGAGPHQAACSDEGRSAAIHDDAEAFRIVGQHHIASAGKGGQDAREAGAVGRGF